MKLFYTELPQSGQIFHLTVLDFVGIARLEWFIEGQFVRRTECPDDPCYEEFRVPYLSSGKIIRIVGQDDVETIEVNIAIGGTSQTPIVAPAGSGSKMGEEV